MNRRTETLFLTLTDGVIIIKDPKKFIFSSCGKHYVDLIVLSIHVTMIFSQFTYLTSCKNVDTLENVRNIGSAAGNGPESNTFTLTGTFWYITV